MNGRTTDYKQEAPLLSFSLPDCAPWGLPPSTSTQGALRCLINITARFRAPDVLVLRSRTLYVYLTVQPKSALSSLYMALPGLALPPGCGAGKLSYTSS